MPKMKFSELITLLQTKAAENPDSWAFVADLEDESGDDHDVIVLTHAQVEHVSILFEGDVEPKHYRRNTG